MKQAKQKNSSTTGWLLFFYSVPSKPVGSRMKIWRRLLKAGALPFKGAAYILPHTGEHYEFLEWLVSEVVSLGGESALVAANKIETVENGELIELFNRQKERDYRAVEKELEELETKLNSVKKGSGTLVDGSSAERLSRLVKSFEEFGKTDFFASRAGKDLRTRIKSMEAEIRGLSGISAKNKSVGIAHRRIDDYRGRVWITRKSPFIDRMASAWLVRRFIDARAAFSFSDERETAVSADGKNVFFDIRGGEFTHVGDLCTFEVLIKAFGLRDKAAKKIAEMVHALDIRDGKYDIPEAAGLEGILDGIRKTETNDQAALEKGIAVFEMLYASKSA